MKLTIQYHLGNPNMCRIPELDIRLMPECEGGGWWMLRDQAEHIVSACAFEDKCIADGWDRATSSAASFVTVPREPTREMLDAAASAPDDDDWLSAMSKAYRAMIAAT